jgi:hypothetical protein
MHWRAQRAARGECEEPVLQSYGRQVSHSGEFAGTMRAVCDRGVRVRLVYSGRFVDQRDSAAQCRMLLRAHGLSGKIEADFLPDVDHVVTSVRAQRRIRERFDAWASDLLGPA